MRVAVRFPPGPSRPRDGTHVSLPLAPPGKPPAVRVSSDRVQNDAINCISLFSSSLDLCPER